MATNGSVVDVRRRAARSVLRVTSPHRDGVAWWDVSELGLVSVGFLAYFIVRGGVVDRTAEALANARGIVALERAYGFFIEPNVQMWVLSSELLWRTMNFVYFWFDFPLIVAVGLLLFWRRRREYTLLRDTLLLSGALALVVYYAYPVAPPRYLPEWGFVDTMALYSELSYQAQSLRPFVNPFAAVPSLHVGWAMLLVISVFRATRSVPARAGVVVVFGLQAVAVIGTGNHFVFDGIVGLSMCALALPLTFGLHRVGYPAMRRRIAQWARPEARPGRPQRRIGPQSLAE
jgi:hypothetical protein